MNALEQVIRDIVRQEVQATIRELAAVLGPAKPARAVRQRQELGVLLSYFAGGKVWSARELAESIGGEPRDVGRQLQWLVKRGELVTEGSRRNTRYITARQIGNGA